MRKIWAMLAMTAVVGMVALGTPSVAQTTDPAAQVRIDLNLKDADLIAATKAVTAQTGIQFVFEGSNEPFNRVTLSLNGVSAEDAITYICQAAGAYCRKDVNGVYVISRTKPVINNGGVVTGPSVAPRRNNIMKKFKLMHTSAEAVYQKIMGSLITFEDDGGAIKRLMQFTNHMTDAERYRSTGVLNPQSLLQQVQPQAVPVSGGQLTGRDTGNNIALPGDSGNQFAGGGGLQGAGGGGLQGGGAGGGLQGGGAGGLQGGATLRGGQGLVPSSIDFISYDPTDNSLLVRGTSEEDIAELQKAIGLFDKAPKQVTVKVEFITTSDSISSNIGYDWLYQRGPLQMGNTPGSFTTSSNPIFINYATGNLSTRVRAALREGKGRIVTAPVLRTLNNQPATVTFSFITYVFFPIITPNGLAGSIITYNSQQLNIGTFLTLSPRINEDGTIVMFINTQVANPAGTAASPDGRLVFPNISQQQVSVVARVKNGETIALGGLTTKNDEVTVNKFPVLGDLPVIGQFFRSTTKAKSTSDLIIFVTPTVIEDDDTGG
ncbi:MAG: hypothetical protein JST35_12875 [Armatimonadetes bacterium]|nr:hypothetical protein [Armatimonadota bacterium]